MSNYWCLRSGLATLSLVLASSAGMAQETCVSLDTSLTVVRTQEYAPLISQATGQDVAPEEVDFMAFMQSGSWSMVYAGTPVADPGYFFFEEAGGQMQFKDVWGGIASLEDRPELVAWAEALGAPSDLATCFAETAASIPDEE